MKIAKKLIDNISNIAKLLLSEAEREKVMKDMEVFIYYFDTLKDLDTEGVEPLTHVNDMKNIFRQDRKNDSLDRDMLLSLAPEQKDGFFKIPKTID
jgi:aspartyl-tRNA(Asn)/glutamyl-tRNA(Gln) amidotransferase subunit C